MEYFGLIKTRRSRRAFQPKPITDAQISKIAESANLAPSAGNLQDYIFYAVKNKEVKEKLAQAALGQSFISDAPIAFVFFAKPSASSRKYGKRGGLYSIIDASIAAAYAQLAAENFGLGTVWVGAFNDEKVKEIFGEEGHPVCILPVGYPAEEPEKNPRTDRLKRIF